MWRSALTPSGLVVDKIAEFPAGLDAVSTRLGVQTFFDAWVVLGDTARLSACEVATRSLEDLIKSNDGQWRRRFTLKGAPTTPATAADPLQAAEPPATVTPPDPNPPTAEPVDPG